MDNQNYFDANRESWNLRTNIHAESEFYDLAAWKAGANSLKSIELDALGNVAGRSLLHLQCHFGQDTLSWGRMGASVTGCDISEEAIQLARQLAVADGQPDAQFVCANVFDLRAHLEGQFDIVFTSYGTIGWLPDLEPWAAVIAHFLKPGGVFFIADFHPVVWMFNDDFTQLTYPYLKGEVIATEQTYTYTGDQLPRNITEYGWNHGIGEILTALSTAGLHLDWMREYSYSPYDCFANTVRGDDGNFRIKGLEDIIPMVYAIHCTRPA
jgi:SAM-dependent methyltransferase